MSDSERSQIFSPLPSPWKIFFILVLFGLIPVVALGIYAWRASSKSISHLVHANNASTAAVTRELVEREFSHHVSVLQGFAGNPDFIQLMQKRDEAAVRDRLQVLVASNSLVERAFVISPDGLLWSDFPKAEESLDKNFSHRDWYKGLSERWQPYVSEVYQRNAEPKRLLVAVAVPVRDPQQNSLVGGVVYQVSLEGITRVLKNVVVGQGGYAFLLDHNGTVAAHPQLDLQRREYDEYAPLLASMEPDGHLEYTDPLSDTRMLVTISPCAVNGEKWTVVVQQPLSLAHRPIWLFAMEFAGAGLLVIGLLALVMFWLLRSHKQMVSMNARLDDMNHELSSENQERRRRMETLLSNLPGMAYRCRNDASWTMELVSQGCFELTGYAADDFVGNRNRAYADLIHAEDRSKVWNDVQRAVSHRQPFTVTYRIETAEGKIKWMWEQGRGVFDENGELLALEGFISDLTQERSLQAQLQQAQKMETIGRLAGGVAHDFNNMLMVISGYCGLALQSAESDENLRDQLEQIGKAADRATGLTRQLLAFSRKQVLQPAVLNLNNVVEQTDKILRRLIGEDIDLVTKLRPDLDLVKCDPGQIEQIIMNLAINARDAMPNGGKLIIETANVELDKAYCDSHADAHPGPHVMIAVSDTGTGMDAETIEKIFEPFFTTKEQGKGTGLGLAMVHGIVKQSGGNIWVYSEPGHGSTFKVYLPKVESSDRLERKAAVQESSPEGNETVLLVEDEEGVRGLLTTVLSGAGYTVLATGDVMDALEICRKHEGVIHLLLTDVVLPKMNGRQLADKAILLRPEMKVVYMSGYTDNAIVHQGVLDPGTAFLEKPIAPNVLLTKIRGFLA